MRLYHDYSKKAEQRAAVCDLFCENDDLDICYVRQIGPYGDISRAMGPIWRFAPMADPLVEEMHSRDLGT